MEMRKQYVATMMQLMETNDKIVILDADLAAAGGTKPIYQAYPSRAINCGIAEANMTCIAVGLAAYGYVPFVHSFAPFVSRRTFDQIAVSASYSNQKIKVVAYDPGIYATANGGTHMSFEDVAAMRALPNVVIVDPTDYVQLEKLLPQIVDIDSSVYLRMPRKLTDKFFDETTEFTLGKATTVKQGSDVSIVATGICVYDAMEAVEKLAQMGISAELINVHTIKPLDEEAILNTASKTKAVLTVENHSVHGGLYGAVCELLSAKLPTRCDAIAIFDKVSQVGNLKDLKRDYNLTADDIVAKAVALVKAK